MPICKYNWTFQLNPTMNNTLANSCFPWWLKIDDSPLRMLRAMFSWCKQVLLKLLATLTSLLQLIIWRPFPFPLSCRMELSVMVTWLSIGNPGIFFKTSISWVLKNAGFFSSTEVEGIHFCVTHQCNSPGAYFANRRVHWTRFLL